jgi:hypothetical protein
VDEQMRISELLRPKFGARDDNTRPELGQSPQVRGEFVQHADTAMRSRVAHPDALVDSHARPGYALHVGHGRLAIDIGTVSPALLDNAEHARWRRVIGYSGRYQRIRNLPAVAVEVKLLLIDGNDEL